MQVTSLISQLVRDEGLKLKPYLDCCGKYWRECTCQSKGKLTIGIGRNLDDVGISEAEAELMNKNDTNIAELTLRNTFPWVNQLDPVRFAVLHAMTFNMGIARLKKFANTLTLIEEGDYNHAAIEMLNSLWAKQVGERAKRLAEQMRSGTWQ